MLNPLPVFIAQLVAKLSALECNVPEAVRPALAALRSLAAEASEPARLHALHDQLSAVAHNSGPALKSRYRLELLALAAQVQMAAQQLPNLDAWKEATSA